MLKSACMGENDSHQTFMSVNKNIGETIGSNAQFMRDLIIADDWRPVQPEGFSWCECKYTGTDKSQEDGAIVKIVPDGRIAVEMDVQSESVSKPHKFWEIWLSGKAKILVCKQGEEPQVMEFGNGKNTINSVLIGQGTIFCIFADPNQESEVMFWESEIPGFTEDALPHVTVDSHQCQNHSISPKFWQEFHRLDSGKRFNPDGTVKN